MEANKSKAKERLTIAHGILVVIAVILAIIYFVWSIDIIPDIVPVVGYLDDAIVGLLVVGFALGMWK